MFDHEITRRRMLATAGLSMAGAGAAGAGLSVSPPPAFAQAGSEAGGAGHGPASDVRTFGARGDGAADDTGAFANALRSLAATGGTLVVPPGVYRVADLSAPSNVQWQGSPGASVLRFAGGQRLLSIMGAENVHLQGLVLDGADRTPVRGEALVEIGAGSKGIVLFGCELRDSGGHGLRIHDASVAVSRCAILGVELVGIVVDSREEVWLESNRIADVDEAGIRVLRSREEYVRTTITGNVVSRIRAKRGGDGPYGNGINVFRAHGVLISGNRVEDCDFSAIRVNKGNGCQIIGNHCVDCRETVIFVEFGASETVVSGNYVRDGGASGIQVVNFDHGGRMAVVAGNVLVRAGRANAIKVDADAVVQGNNIDGSRAGILVGFGKFLKDIVVDGNLIYDSGSDANYRLQHGILVAIEEEAGNVMITNNRISGFAERAIYGHDVETPVPLGGNLFVSGNYPGIPSTDLPATAVGGSINYEPDTGRLVYYAETGRRVGWHPV